MPIYAYRCDDCGHTLEALQKMSEAPLTECPKCGHSSLKKQLTAAGFQLKGNGWYQTDFRGQSGGAASGGKSAPAAKSDPAPEKPGAETPASCGAGCACCR